MSGYERVTRCKLRSAGRLDAALLAALHQESFKDGGATGEIWDEGAMMAALAMPEAGGLIAECKSAPRGFVLFRVAADEGEILSIGVLPEYRRQGIGRDLLRTALAHCHEAGARRLFLEVSEDNAAACGLYRSEGLSRVGRRDHYYRALDGATQAALILGCDLFAVPAT